ncbi:UvrD-helicase domain-containing protein [Microbacterium sp. NIBRBAC000506063]|uniref:UvrD-helicase domain-containing protein n=1 Tax=Microbacterium sp. NIBRBAC000506063 TaxID=2734618 RepID=UPI0039816C2B
MGGFAGISATDVAAALGLPSPTPAQQSVIEAPPSPALVVAGAGSGKTETMSGRVVWLVANGHVRRDEILGLTFTRKAAGELAERIGARLAVIDEYGRRGLLAHLPEIVASGALTRVDDAAPGRQRALVRRHVLDELAVRFDTGWDPASTPAAEDVLIRPRVSTYNAFADGIVREHAARIGRDPDAAMLSQAASWMLARDVVLRADLPGLEDIDLAVGTVVDAVQRLAGDALDHRADLDRADRIAVEQAAAFAPGAATATSTRRRATCRRFRRSPRSCASTSSRSSAAGCSTSPTRSPAPTTSWSPRRMCARNCASSTGSCCWTSTRTPR